jgi:hypothetical protein
LANHCPVRKSFPPDSATLTVFAPREVMRNVFSALVHSQRRDNIPILFLSEPKGAAVAG